MTTVTRRLLIVLCCAVLAVAVCAGCGKKGRLHPRDATEYGQGELPPDWQNAPPPKRPGADLGIDGLLDAIGAVDQPTPPAATPEPAAENEPAEENDDNQENP